MNVRTWCVLGAAIVATAGQLARAEEGRPSRQSLTKMGLSGIVMMSDDEAEAVRGKGFMGGGSSVQVFGNSFATINGVNGGAHSENGYAASGSHFAAGANGSVAGVIHIATGGQGPGGGNGGGMDTWSPGKTGGMNPWTRTRMPGGNSGGYGGMGGQGGRPGGINIHATVFFAGGFSFGVAH